MLSDHRGAHTLPPCHLLSQPSEMVGHPRPHRFLLHSPESANRPTIADLRAAVKYKKLGTTIKGNHTCALPFFCISFGVLTSVVGFTQNTDTRAQFEVASLKPSSPDVPFRMTGGPRTPDPGRWMCVGWSLENFLLKAYNLRSYQLSAPRWVRSAMFTVNATMPAGTTREEFPLMQQRLLEDVSTSQYGPRHCDDGALIQPCRTATAVS